MLAPPCDPSAWSTDIVSRPAQFGSGAATRLSVSLEGATFPFVGEDRISSVAWEIVEEARDTRPVTSHDFDGIDSELT